MGYLAVVIPGIGGSELRDPDRPGGEGRVWYSGRRSLIDLVADPERLQIDRPLLPVGLLHRFSVIPWFKNLDGYSSLWTMISGLPGVRRVDEGHPCCPDLSADVVAFPYDFRLGVSDAATKLDAMLRTRFEHLGDDTKVVFVAHSMGGLVAREWAARPGNAARCRGMITLGTPHRGAPKALDVLVNGLRWGPLERTALSDVVRGWPGLADLVGIDRRIVDTRTGERHRVDTLPERPATLDERCAASTTLHDTIAETWESMGPERRPIVVPVAGAGHATPSIVKWDGKRFTLRKHPIDGEPLGDATVPYWSAIPFEFFGKAGTQQTRRRNERHGALAAGAELRMQIEQLLGNDPPRRGPDRPVRGPSDVEIGLDLDDIVEPGCEILGEVLLDGAEAGEVSVEVHASTDDGQAGATDLSVDVDADWRFCLVAPASGDGDVVTVRAVVRTSSGGRLLAADRVAVVA